jgi:membrane-associated phospholipid phosphatase
MEYLLSLIINSFFFILNIINNMNEIFINFYLQNNKIFKNFYNISLFISNLFNSKSLFVILFILYISNILSINQIIQFLILTSLLIFIKYLIKRPRPFNVDKKIKNLDNSNLDPYSFPSGHMFTASLLMMFLNVNYNLSLLLIILVGFSRIILGVHYLSDVIASYLLAKFLFNYLIN